MGNGDETKRIVAECSECGAVYTAQLRSDGNISPIGNPSGCRCGSTDFINLNERADDIRGDTDELPEE